MRVHFHMGRTYYFTGHFDMYLCTALSFCENVNIFLFLKDVQKPQEKYYF